MKKLCAGAVLEEMVYGEAVLREMLRTAPPVPFVYREALQDLDVGGYKVPKVPELYLCAPVVRDLETCAK